MDKIEVDTSIVNIDELLASLLTECTKNNEPLTNELTFEYHLQQMRSIESGIDEEICAEMYCDEKTEEFINECV